MGAAVLVDLAAPPDPLVELVVVPFAGGGPSRFRSWVAELPPGWALTAVCLAGREARFGDDPPASLAAAAGEVVRALAARPSVPRVLFGHSFGAVVALEVARQVPPRLLAVAACPPPSALDTRGAVSGDDEEAEAATREMLARDIGDPELVEELVALHAPVMAADMRLLAGYRPPADPLTTPVVAYYGDADDVVPASWGEVSAGDAAVVVIDGDHSFPQSRARPLLADLAARAGSTERPPAQARAGPA